MRTRDRVPTLAAAACALLIALPACTGTLRVGARTVWLGDDQVALHGVLAMGLGAAVDDDERAVIGVAELGAGGRFDPTLGHIQSQFGADYVDFSAIDHGHEGLGWRIGARFGAAIDLADTTGDDDEAVDETDGDASSSFLIAWPVALLWTFEGSSGGGGGKYSFNLSPDETFLSIAVELTPIWLLDETAYDSPFGLGAGVYFELDTIEAW